MREQGFPATLLLNFTPKPDVSPLLIPLYCLVTRNVSGTHSQEFQSNKQPMEENLALDSLVTKEPGAENGALRPEPDFLFAAP